MGAGKASLIGNKDLLAGGVFLALGGLFAVRAYLTLRIGTPAEMGPGYFPLMAGVGLCAIGAIIAGRSFYQTSARPFGNVTWRGMTLIALAPILFGILVRPFGFVPALVVAVLVSCFASSSMSPIRALGISVVLTAVCVAIFRFGLGLNLPLLIVPGV